MKFTVSATALTVGDIIIDGKDSITVKKIAPCTETVLRGLPKIHVNDSLCYHSIAPIEIIRKGR